MLHVNLSHLYSNDKILNTGPQPRNGFTISKVHCVRGMLRTPQANSKERIKAVADSQQEHRLLHTHSRQPFTIPAAAPVKAQSPEAFSCPLPPLPHFLCHAGPTASSCRHLSHPFFKPVPYRASMHCSCCILY